VSVCVCGRARVCVRASQYSTVTQYKWQMFSSLNNKVNLQDNSGDFVVS
jgi:hypothetical protein